MKRFNPQALICLIIICSAQVIYGQTADSLHFKFSYTLPEAVKTVDGKPSGKHWVNLLDKPSDWNADTTYWHFGRKTLHGAYKGGAKHNYAWTKKNFSDYELSVEVKMEGREANSGVCIRINPTDADNVPGYQVDMGPGYWGCLWEERRAGMVVAYPKILADQLVHANDWNHYYIKAKGHHIEAWLNGVKTIDIVHEAGYSEGAIGFQLCHGDKETIVSVRNLFIRITPAE